MPKFPSMAPPPYYEDGQTDPNSKNFDPEALADELENDQSCGADTFDKPITASRTSIPIISTKSLISGTPVDTPDCETNEILESMGITNPNTFRSDNEIKESERADQDEDPVTLPDEDLQMAKDKEEVIELKKQLEN